MTKIQALRDELEELADREECGECEDTPRNDCTSDGCPCIEPLDADERERLAELRDFEASTPDWDSLIHEDDFEDYAREFAKDILCFGGAIIDTSAWPATCIDWERAANELRQDFTSYEIDGDTYYSRD
jgi:hypothetical protein